MENLDLMAVKKLLKVKFGSEGSAFMEVVLMAVLVFRRSLGTSISKEDFFGFLEKAWETGCNNKVIIERNLEGGFKTLEDQLLHFGYKLQSFSNQLGFSKE